MRSDGVRYVALPTVDGELLLLDTQTGRRRLVPRRGCSSSSTLSSRTPASGEYELISLSAGLLVWRCSVGSLLLTTSAADLAVVHEATYAPTTATNGPPATAGSSWARFPSCLYAGSNNISCEGEQLFNTASGAVYPGKVAPSSNSFADLNAPTLMRPLCTPVRLTNARLPGMGPYEQVEGVQWPWVLVRQARGGDQGEYLLAWHCGWRQPTVLGRLFQRAQLGAGLVSWEEPGGGVEVEKLVSGQRMRWAAQQPSSAEYPVLHTARAVFIERVARSGGRSVLTATLAPLHARTNQAPPAGVAPPEGISVGGP